MKREAEQTWAAERVENALLRERINDIAAEISRLTAALEGQASPIEAMLAGEPIDAKAASAKPRPATPARREQGQSGRPHPRPADEGVAGSAAELTRLSRASPSC